MRKKSSHRQIELSRGRGSRPIVPDRVKVENGERARVKVKVLSSLHRGSCKSTCRSPFLLSRIPCSSIAQRLETARKSVTLSQNKEGLITYILREHVNKEDILR